MLSLYKLEIFSVVVQHGSFSAAANHLYMTQSAVSQHMQDLEASLGTRLFTRGRRGVTLTASGETLHAYTVRILRLVAEAENEVVDVTHLESGQAAIGATPSIGNYLVSEWIRAFRAAYPNLSLALHTDTTAQLAGRIANQTLEVAFVEGELDSHADKRLRSLNLAEIEQYVVIGQTHPWWDRQTLSLHEIDQQSIVMRQTGSQTRSWQEDLFKRHNLKPMITAEFDSPEAIKQSVLSGGCLAILPDYAVRREKDLGLMQLVAVEDVPLTRTLKLIWNQQRLFSPIAKAFLRRIAADYPALNEML